MQRYNLLLMETVDTEVIDTAHVHEIKTSEPLQGIPESSSSLSHLCYRVLVRSEAPKPELQPVETMPYEVVFPPTKSIEQEYVRAVAATMGMGSASIDCLADCTDALREVGEKCLTNPEKNHYGWNYNALRTTDPKRDRQEYIAKEIVRPRNLQLAFRAFFYLGDIEKMVNTIEQMKEDYYEYREKATRALRELLSHASEQEKGSPVKIPLSVLRDILKRTVDWPYKGHRPQ